MTRKQHRHVTCTVTFNKAHKRHDFIYNLSTPIREVIGWSDRRERDIPGRVYQRALVRGRIDSRRYKAIGLGNQILQISTSSVYSTTSYPHANGRLPSNICTQTYQSVRSIRFCMCKSWGVNIKRLLSSKNRSIVVNSLNLGRNFCIMSSGWDTTPPCKHRIKTALHQNRRRAACCRYIFPDSHIQWDHWEIVTSGNFGVRCYGADTHNSIVIRRCVGSASKP